MSRKTVLSPKVFNLKKDVDQISRLYHPHQQEVAQFLHVEHASGKLQGMRNEEVFEMISHELGHTVQQ